VSAAAAPGVDAAPAPARNESLARLRHDLRTPINHILGYAELLQEELADNAPAGQEEFASDLKKIHSAAQALLKLVNTHLSPDGFAALVADCPPGEERAAADHALPANVGEKALFTDSGDSTPAREEEPEAPIPGKILVVDDNPANRETLCRRLQKQGHLTVEAGDGRAALRRLRDEPFDLVLLDVMMPELDGYSALREMKGDRSLREIPVIMISALDELESVVRCIEAGAEDYLPKPFEPTLLRARIGASLEKKTLRDQERHYLRTIEQTQRRLGKELEEAANYVRSILPPPVPEPPIRIDWRFVPSTELGGDSFGYHWLDEDHFAIYLLDVCGHGVGAALLSVAAINVLRTGSLSADFRDPAAVLSLLNETFPMERHNNMYFTLWYGVYNRRTRTLRHASGGHPPALFLDGGAEVRKLRSPGLVIGVMPGVDYRSDTVEVPHGTRLFVLSDGTYEIKKPDGGVLAFEEFEAFFREHGAAPDFLDRLGAWVHELNAANGPGPLDDDFSIVCLDF